MSEPTPALNALRAKLDGALASMVADEAKRIGNGAGRDDGLSDEHRALAKGIAVFVREAIAEATTPLRARIAELESRPSMKYCGIWDAQKVYRAGDCVTCVGVLWHAGEASVGQHPGEGATAWKLMHKTKGRL